MEHSPYWWTTRDYRANFSLQEDLSVDVAIIGGGYSGLSTAYHLKKMDPSLRVLILEGESIGFGASGRNAGFGMTLFGLSMQITKLRFGSEKVRQAHLYMENAVDHLWEMIQKHNLDCDAERSGFLRVATSATYARRIQDEIKLAHRLGLKDIDWLSKSQVEDRVRSDLFQGAWWEPRCVLLNPAKLAWEMKRVVEDMGVLVAEHTPARKLTQTPKGYVIQTPGGHVQAQKIALTTNAFSSGIKQLKSLQVPVYTYIIVTEPLGNRITEIGWTGREGIEDARNLIHYFRLTKDNRLLMGGGNVALPFGSKITPQFDTNTKTFEHLKQFMGQVFPNLKGTPITHGWGGPISATLDLAPAMGYLGKKKDAVYSLGCIGHGVSMTQYNGLTLAEMLLERESERTDFFVIRRPIPWPPEPLQAGISRGLLKVLQIEDRLRERNQPQL